VLLLAVVLVLMVRAGIGAQTVRRLGQGAVELPGIQYLLGRLDLGWAGVDAKARQLLERGAALEDQERYNEALRLYREAQELMPDEVEPYLALAGAYQAQGEWDDALEQAEKAVEVDAEDARAQRQMGILRCLHREYPPCIEALEKAVELAPDDSENRYWLGIAYQQGAQDGFVKAREQLIEALQLDPDSGMAHFALGSLYRGQPGNEALAFEELSRALDAALESGDVELETKARSELAAFYYARDNYAQCVEQWLEVLKEYPEDADAHRRIALCYAMRREKGDIEQAIDEFEQALQLDFEQMDAYYFYLGQYYASQDDYPRAFLAWEQFLRFSDDEELKADVREWLDAYQEAMTEEAAP
jgi:tetratricopeptide (TPR) repeat protein